MIKQKEIWFGLDKSTDLSTLEKVFNLGYSHVFLTLKELNKLEYIYLPKRINLSLLVNSSEEFNQFLQSKKISEKTDYIFTRDLVLLENIKSYKQYKCGLFLAVNDKTSLDHALKNAVKADIVIVDFKDPTNIPLELILATVQSTQTRIFKKTNRVSDSEVSLLTMEKGSDGILFMNNNLDDLIHLSQIFDKSQQQHFQLLEAVVTRIEHAGMGDRVCIDTTSELLQNEGMLLGSTSSGGLMVCSETHFLPYMNLRPFRVNAGGLHMYIWGPHNMSVYLSDLKSGDKVYAVNTNGKARIVTIGRLKIERRPLLLIETEMNGVKVNVFIQDDWHVRIFGSKGEIIPSSEIKIGDKLLGFLDEPGRHVGIKINETIKEV